MSVQTQVIQIEPDWLLVCFTGTKPPVEKRRCFLHRTLSDWLGDHPSRQVSRTVAIQHDGALVGVHVWLDGEPVAEAQMAPRRVTTNAPPPASHDTPRRLGDAEAEREFSVNVDADLMQSIHKEHLEAFLQHAYSIFFKENSQAPVLAVINRSGLAVVFDRSSEQSHLTRAAKLGLRGEATEELSRWQTASQSNYFVLPMTAFRPEK